MSEVAEGPVKDGRVLQVIGAVVDVEVRYDRFGLSKGKSPRTDH